MLSHRHLKSDIRIVQLCPIFGRIDHRRGCVNTCYDRTASREFESELAIAAAHVEDPAAVDVAEKFKDQLAFEPLGDGADL